MSKYISLGMDTDLGALALEECAWIVGPAFSYELHVNRREQRYASGLCKQIGAHTAEHPFSPYINVVIDETLSPGEWYIQSYDKAAGSKGIP